MLKGKFQNRVAMGAASASLLLAAACATPDLRPVWTPTGDPVADGKAALEHAPPKDKVLWQYRTALEAMRRGQYPEAKALLDDALLTLAGSSANDKEAKRSRGYFSEESRKPFRGEPYERVMAYYYRGILYWMDGEPDNARACFRSAQLEDSDSQGREYSSDYVLLDYLDGLSTVKLRGDGADSLKRAQSQARLGASPPNYDPAANTLFFVEFGRGPTKFATGEHAEQLRFREGSSPARSAVLKLGDQVIAVSPYDDLNFQATTRGGRVMDHILANKVVFKNATDAVGTAALISGAVIAQNQKNQEVGLGLIAAGILGKIVSAAATPAADTRCWNNLPQFLGFASVSLPAGQHTATVEFLDASGNVLTTFTKTVTVHVSPVRDTVVFVSDRSPTSKLNQL